MAIDIFSFNCIFCLVILSKPKSVNFILFILLLCISGAGQMSGTYGGYLEQSEINDKKVDQLTREKRDLLSKNLKKTRSALKFPRNSWQVKGK